MNSKIKFKIIVNLIIKLAVVGYTIFAVSKTTADLAWKAVKNFPMPIAFGVAVLVSIIVWKYLVKGVLIDDEKEEERVWE